MNRTTLYKVNNVNKISWWTIEQEGRQYVISWGRDIQFPQSLSGQSVHDFETEVEAIKDYKSRINRQKNRNGYSVRIPNKVPDKPMLAQKWQDHKDKVFHGRREDFQGFALQPKLDGIRCISDNQHMLSRRGTRITSCTHIKILLENLPPGIRLDGELYHHGMDLEIISGYVRRDHSTAMTKELKYHVFDCIDDEATYEERHKKVCEAVDKLQEVHKQLTSLGDDFYHLTKNFPIEVVPTQFHKEMEPCSEQGKHLLKQEFKKATKDGYEGIIIRDIDSEYSLNYRSPYLLKYKEVMDEEFQIVEVMPGHEQTAVFVLITKEGVMFEATPAWTKIRKQRAWKNRDEYKDRWATVEFERYSKDGKPLKAILKRLRDPEETK